MNGGLALSQKLGPVLLLTLIFFINFVARQIVGPLLPAIEVELGLSHSQSGLFLLFMGTGFFIGQILAVFLSGRWGYRRCIFISIFGMAVAVLMIGLLHGIWSLYLGFLVLGLTSGLYVPAGIALITVLIKSKDWGKAMGIHEVAPNLALILAPYIATAAVAEGSWRLGYLCISAALALIGMIYAWLGVDAHQIPSPPNFYRVREIANNPTFWYLGFLLSLSMGVEMGVYAVIPLFLVNERSFDLSDANQLLGLSRIPGLFLVIFVGWVTDRLSPSTAVTLALGFTGIAVAALGIGPTMLLAPAVFLQSAASACLFPPILSMASQVSSTENRPLALSLSMALATMIGGGLFPAGIALTGDLVSFGIGLVGVGLLTMAGIGLVILMGRGSLKSSSSC